MLRTLDSERDRIIRTAKNEADVAERFGPLVARYLEHVPIEDLRLRTPSELAAMAGEHGALASVRPPGRAVVQVRAGVLLIVTDDMPFLVDSVTSELTRQGREMHLLVHPQIVVRRDVTGALREVLEVAASSRDLHTLPHDAVVESWIRVEIDPAEGDHLTSAAADAGPALPDDAALVADMRDVLEDVRTSVEDWPRMRRAAEDLARSLPARVPTDIDASQVRQAVDLLRWLADDHFTFLGYREYGPRGEAMAPVAGSGLGILRHDRSRTSDGDDSVEAGPHAPRPHLLTLTKSNAMSTVHRRAYMDYVGVTLFDDDGRVVGECHFIGLFASSAYTDSVRRIPVLARKVYEVLQRTGFDEESHSGKELLEILETFPRDELFEIDVDDLTETVVSVMHLQERRRTKLFVRRDAFGRYASCLIYLPRDRFTTQVGARVQELLAEAFGGVSTDFSARVGESVLARLYLVVRVPAGSSLPTVDVADVERRLIAATRTWREDLVDALVERHGEPRGLQIARQWAGAFPEAYKEDVSVARAVEDVERLLMLEAPASESTPTSGLRLSGEGPATRRFTLYRSEPVTLTAVLPYLANLGAEVVDERPYRLERADGVVAWVYDFGLRFPQLSAETVPVSVERAADLFCEAFAAAWSGRTESDGFDRLVLLGGLEWRQIVVMRAYAKYLRQTGSAFSQAYIERCLCTYATITRHLVRLFEARFAPDLFREGRREVAEALADEITTALDDVTSLDHDRILRSYLALIQATRRTNHFVTDGPASGGDDPVRPALSLKLDPRQLAELPGLPAPLPWAEVFVYSPEVEGVHLRFGAVARGGLRWSDRREDFRTEVLGLVKAQTVKNAVIVPTGAKGGFVPKRLPDPGLDREAWLAEGVACYRSFISGLLDITDDRRPAPDGQGTVIVPPPRVVRHDDDDPYLVVAADKGTAAFSDIANALAARYGFWLGDAFASGGSVGYDHKAMGITARGAWESVKRHFRELGVDPEAEEVTAVGVGDMSGDVFGNGMLLSRHLRLVAAFDHRHVFLDPEPDAAASFEERARLFALPRSSWADYDQALISAGGGVYPRTAKSVPISPQVAERLGLTRRGSTAPVAMTPSDLISAILRAPVDLLWNGGIGTYIKASTESHADAGDKANDSLRIDGGALRVRVVGEGGNLGLTQRGRIEAALAGVRLNSDAIDNSAGVDCSDHEVNIKVLLDRVVGDGDLTLPERDALLRDMTDDVSSLVLRHNYAQNVLLASARAQSRGMSPVHIRQMRALESNGALDRDLEFLPSDSALTARTEGGHGLTSPELSVLAAYAKITLADELITTALPDDPWLDRLMRGYFPAELVARYGDRLATHPLRREIVTNVLSNDMIDLGGISFVFRAHEETGAPTEQIARAFVVVREIFGLDRLMREIEALDGAVPATAQSAMQLLVRRLLDRGTRWFLRRRPAGIEVGGEVEHFAGTLAALMPQLPAFVVGGERARMRQMRHDLVETGLPDHVAEWGARLLLSFALLDVTEVAARTGSLGDDVARIYLRLSERYAADELLDAVARLTRRDRWQALARAALRDEIFAGMEALTEAVLRATAPGASAAERITLWEDRQPVLVERSRRTLRDVARIEIADLAPLSVAAATLRTVVRAGDAPSST